MPDIALIGCGNWGKNILRDLVRLGCRVHVADPDPAARQRALGLGAAAAYSDLTELPDVAGFVVAVPIPDLTPVTAALLPRGKPVFAEKTLCRSLADYHLLRSLPGSGQIFAMHKWHYHPGIERLRQIIAAGTLGELRELVTTRYAWVKDFHGGDVFWTQAIHDLTIIKHLLGQIPQPIRACHVIRDACGLPVSLRAILGTAPVVFLSVSGRHTSKISGVSAHGSCGSAELADALDDHLLVTTDRGTSIVSIDTEYPLYLELAEFLAYLGGGPRPRCDLESAREMTEALLKLRKAAGIVLHRQESS